MASCSTRVRLALALGAVVLFRCRCRAGVGPVAVDERPARRPRPRALTTPVSRSAASSCWPTGAKPWGNPANPGTSRFFELRHGVPGQLRLRRRLQRLPGLRHLQPVGAGCSRAPSSARAARVTSRSTGTCSSCPSRRRARQEGLHASTTASPTTGERASAACASSTSRTSNAPRARRRRARPAAVRTRTRSSRARTIRTPSTSTSPARPGTIGQTDDLTTCDAGPATQPEPVAVADRGHQGPARATRQPPRSSMSRACSRTSRPARVNGLQNAPQTPQHPCASTTPAASTPAPTPRPARRHRPDTNSCHDITVYEALDIAAGSCEGNGLLLDISDPANPKRIDAVADPLFAYWHGATFSNDGKYVVFTDEWGGGTTARCRATDQLSWGADAIYEIVNKQARVPQLLQAAGGADDHRELRQPHPVARAGRTASNIMVQAWYQGGASLVDFTNPSNAEGDRLLRPRPDQRDARSSSAATGRPTGTTARSTARSSPAASTRSSSRRRRDLTAADLDTTQHVPTSPRA